MMLLKMYLSII